MSQSIEAMHKAETQPAAAYLAGLRSGVSRNSMQTELNKIARLMHTADWQMVDWASLNAANVMAIMAQIEGAPSTRNKTLSALKGVAKTAWRLGKLDSETLARINDVKGDSGSRELAGRQIESWEVAALMRACADDPTPSGARDSALFAVAQKTGARREELTALLMDSIKRDADTAELKVVGKRNKERTLYLDNGALLALVDWLSVRGDAPGVVFCAIRQTGAIEHLHRMTTTALHKILQKRLTEAGLKSITWHDFRRSFAGSLLDAGEDIATVASMMGHASVNTTARYDRRPAEARRKAARKISTPYFGRQNGR